jgi:hypothetical protein
MERGVGLLMAESIEIRRALRGLALLIVAAFVCLPVGSVDAAETRASKAYWHSVGNDRFRAYDAGGRKEPKEIRIPTGFGRWGTISVTIPWHSIEPDGSIAGPNPYRSSYTNAEWWQYYREEILASNRRYAKKVDWPVEFIFKNQASIGFVKERLRQRGLDTPGSRMYLSLADSRSAGSGPNLWDADGGLKEFVCSNPWIGPEATNHIRLYADSQGSGFSGNRDDMMVNKHWGYYVLGTTHIDYLECPGGAKKFGWSETARQRLMDAFHPAFKQWNPGCFQNGVHHSTCYNKLFMANKENRREGNHIWESDGYAAVVRVGEKPSAFASINDPGEEDEDLEQEEEGGEEGPPPLEPAIDGDVDGDDRADLVAAHTSGVVHTYSGLDASDRETPFGGGLDSALFDGREHHVIDVADVDADGYSDLVTMISNSPLGLDNTVAVFPGQGDGKFGSGVLARGGMVPGTFGPGGHEPIGVADVTGDRRADLVTFYAPQGNFYVYPGLASRQFGDGITTGGGQLNSALFDQQGIYFVDVADVNGDGRADVVTDDGGVYIGHASGIWQWRGQHQPLLDSALNNANGNEALGAGDVNGDGKADLVMLNSSGAIAVYAGTNELVSATQTYRTLAGAPVTSHSGLNSNLFDGSGDEFVGVMDRTGDGRADLFKVNGEGTVSIATGQPNLQFGAFETFKAGIKSNRFNFIPGYEMLQEKHFIRRVGCSPAGCIGRPQPPESDVDGDRRGDLVTLDMTGTSHTYRAVGAKGHATSFNGTMDPALYDGKGHHVIDVADVNGDFRADKVTLAEGTVLVYPGKTDGTFGAPASSFAGTMTPGPRDPNGFEPIAVADVTNDGRGDLVAFKEGQGVKVYPGSLSATFGAPIVSLSTIHSGLFNEGGGFLDVVDATGDSLPDLISGGAVYKGSATGEFTYWGSMPLYWVMTYGSRHEPIGFGDVNGDRVADLVTYYENPDKEEVAIYIYPGPAGSGAPSIIFSGAVDSNLVDGIGDEMVGLLDEDGDQLADLITARDDGTVRIYSGNKNLTFSKTPKVRYLPEYRPGRFNRLPGHESVSQKPFVKRAGCSEIGCHWPPSTVESDVNGDRRSDLIGIDTEGTAHVYKGYADGFNFPTGGKTTADIDDALFDGQGEYTVDAADVDGDRKSDLVTLNTDGELRVRPGRGDRTFGSPILADFTLPSSIHGPEGFESIAVADVTGDSRGDLVGFYEDGGVRFLATYPGRPSGTFQGPGEDAAYSQIGAVDSAMEDRSGDYFIDAVDVDGDGRADVLSMNTSGQVRFFKGQADGTFANPVGAASIDPIMDNGSGHEPAGLGDVTGDGRADLVTRDPNGYLRLFAGKADGTFAAPTQAFFGNTSNPPQIDSSLLDGKGVEFVGLLDYSRDGRADLVVVDQYALIRTYKAKTDGTFDIPWTHYGMPSRRYNNRPGFDFPTQKPTVASMGCDLKGCESPPVNRVESDVDGDRRSDIVTIHTDGKALVRRGVQMGFEVFSPKATLAGQIDSALYDGSGHYAIDVADVDGDSYGDLVTRMQSGEMIVHKGKPDATFATGVEAYGVPGQPIAAADVTGDNRADLVEFRNVEGIGRITVAPGQADASFSAEADVDSLVGEVDSALGDASGHYFLDAVDVTGDRHADLVSMTTSGQVRVYKGEANGQFAATSAIAASIDPILDDGVGQEPVGVGDVTGDELADLVTLSGTSLLLHAGKADGTFAASVNAYPYVGASPFDSSLLDGKGRELAGLLSFSRDLMADLLTVSDDGVVMAHNGLAEQKFGYGAALDGALTSNRFGERPGEEIVTEKPIMRRAGCTASGCDWPSAPLPPGPEPSIPDWSASPVDSHSSIEDVWCESGEDCVAVGRTVSDSGAKGAHFAHWDGTSWERRILEVGEGELSGVTCLSAEECIAVGSYDEGGIERAMVLQGNGYGWWMYSNPIPAGAKSSQLSDIACTSAELCVAVGSYVDASGIKRTLAVHGTGVPWSIVSTPSSSLFFGGTFYPAMSTELSGIDCAGSYCFAVGTLARTGDDVEKGFGLKWDGTSWKAAEAPGLNDSRPRELSAIACASATHCMAVGSYVDTTDTRRAWGLEGNGSSWWGVPTPNRGGSSFLSGIWCDEWECTAGGSSRGEAGKRPFLATWAQTGFNTIERSHQIVALPAGSSEGEFLSVFCTGSGECQAAGSLTYGTNGPRSYAYRFGSGGSGHTMVGGAGGTLHDVSCPEPESCLAVSDSFDPLPDESQQRAHFAWDISGSELTVTSMAERWGMAMNGVSCTEADSCDTAGEVTYGSGYFYPSVSHWEGASWTDAWPTYPSTLGGELKLNDISCESGGSCMAVGWYYDSVAEKLQVLAEWWDGSAWTLKSPPIPSGATGSKLRDVHCLSASDCLTVGSYSDSVGTHALIARWNGTTWTTQTSPMPSGTTHALLDGVSCSAANACTAVGRYNVIPGDAEAMALRWNGSAWSVQLSAGPEGSASSKLHGVDCYGASGCVAVGAHSDGSGDQALALRWNGSAWTTESTPSAPDSTSRLQSVSCGGSAERCVAVGATDYDVGHAELLVLSKEE